MSLDLTPYRRRWIDRTYSARDFADLIDEVADLRRKNAELIDRLGRSARRTSDPGGAPGGGVAR